MSTRGPVAIDWFDAAIGHPAADVARTSLLIHAPRSGREHQHLPGGSPDILNRFRSHYLEGVDEISGFTGRDMSVWESVVAASRLAENVQIEESDLLDIWRQRERS
jgi:aminoglycoside phosphotransferase (APT) family kinase protein